jgi:AraC-like DNA-binding protein
MLADFGLTEERLAEPWGSLSVRTTVALLERARKLTGEPGLGFHLGLQKRASGYGYPGFAALSAASYAQALDLAIRFAPLLTTAISLRLLVEAGVASLIVDEHSDAGSARDIALIALLVGLRQVGVDITAGRLNASLEFTIPEPHYYRRFANLVTNIRFGQPLNRMVFDVKALALPLAMSDAAALRLANDQCELALRSLGSRNTLEARVRQALPAGAGFRSMREVAAELKLSPRTLARKLASDGISFTELVDVERRERALRLLRHSDLSVDDLAEQVGYSTASGFCRAFFRWTGRTPAAYRRECEGPEEPLDEAGSAKQSPSS